MILAARKKIRLISCLKKAEHVPELLREVSIIDDYIDLVLPSRTIRERNFDGSFLFRRFSDAV